MHDLGLEEDHWINYRIGKIDHDYRRTPSPLKQSLCFKLLLVLHGRLFLVEGRIYQCL